MTAAGSPPEQALDGPTHPRTTPDASRMPPGGPAEPGRTRRTADDLECLRAQLTDTQRLLDDYLVRLDGPVAATGAQRA